MENKENIDPKSPNQAEIEKTKITNARKEGLTRGALTAGIIGFVVLVLIGVVSYTRYSSDHKKQLAVIEDQQKSFNEQLTARDSMINDWLSTFDQIEQNLSAIKQKENILSMKSTGSEFTKDRKNQVLEDIKSINNLIEENKKKIAQLNAALKRSGNTITGLQVRIDSLQASMSRYETQVADLRTSIADKDLQIDQLNTTVVALNDTVSMQDQTISTQTNRLNTAYVASGTYKDLKEKGLLEKEGGFLGLGRKESMIQDFPDSLFKKIDVTETTTIPVNSKNVKLITEHPSGSYDLVREGENNIAYIEIKNPKEFWKISKYAVVELIK
jgi:predicted  nucleic acid-binding Zn-ribbon protein